MKTDTTEEVRRVISGSALPTIGLMCCLIQMATMSPVQAQCRQALLTAADPVGGDAFGFRLSLSGDSLIVGAPLSNSAYIFERNAGGPNDWGQVAELMGGFQFGITVSISGDVAVAGPGVALVFERDMGGPGNWGQVATLSGDIDGFASSVSVDGDVLVLGSPLENISAGAAYVYERNAGGASNWGEVAQLTPDDPIQFKFFGSSVSIRGDIVVVGAYADPHAGDDSGSAYVFERNAGGPNNWGQVAKLTADDAAAGDIFGVSVVVDGEMAIVGSPFHNSDEGAAYVFERNAGGVNNWGQVKKFMAADGEALDYFGISVSISGDVAVAGSAPDDNIRPGAAYVFDRNLGGPDNWGLVAKYTADDPEVLERFGTSVSASGEFVAVGSPGDDFFTNPGEAYLFLTTTNCCPAPEQTSCQQAEVTSFDGSIGAFGRTVSHDGTLAITGAPADDEAGLNSGAAYIYAQDGGDPTSWSGVIKLFADDAAPNDIFGASVSINGAIAVVGSSRNDDACPGDPDCNSGSAYVFEQNTGGPDNWGQIAKLTADDAAAGDIFGLSVSVSGDVAVVGASLDDDACPGDPDCDSGSAYVFERNAGGPDNWGEVAKLTADDASAQNSFGRAVSVSGDLVAVLSSNTGVVYLFERDVGGPGNWGQVIKLSPDGGASGFSVSADGDFVIVGTPFENSVAGSAQIFGRNAGGPDNWGLVKTITASDAAPSDLFGYSVAIKGDLAVVGAYGDDDEGNLTGSAYLFQRNAGGPDNWGEINKLIADDAASFSRFGVSVSVQGDLAVVGTESTASFYVFLTTPAPDCGSCAGDLNGNEFVDGEDVQLFLDCVMTGVGCECSDLDGDCRTADVDFADDVAAFVDRLVP